MHLIAAAFKSLKVSFWPQLFLGVDIQAVSNRLGRFVLGCLATFPNQSKRLSSIVS